MSDEVIAVKNTLSSVFHEEDQESDFLIPREIHAAGSDVVFSEDHAFIKNRRVNPSKSEPEPVPIEIASVEDGEKFLQDYIANMGWRNARKIKESSDAADAPSSESESDDEASFLDKVDEFETKYNFRFEEEGGNAISSHARQVEDSVRVKDSKRKRERDLKNARKEEEKKHKLIELKKLKNLRREEINRRLEEIEKVTGTKTDEKLSSLLETDFDPSTYDGEMDELLGPDYYENPDDDFDQLNESGDLPEEGEAEMQERREEDNMWYFCDSCIRPIKPGNIGYECNECEEERTVCHNCKQQSNGGCSHKLKKFKVADHEVPPDNWQEVLLQLKKKRSKDIASGKLDDLYGMEFEDVIGGDVACRFKYAKVDSDSFGLSPEAILMGSDKELNQKVSLKNLHPYRKAHAFKRVKYHDGQRRSLI